MKFKRLSIVLLGIFFISACAKKPEQRWQVAMNGAYSATINQRGYALVLGSFQHGGSYWDVKAIERLYNWNHREGYLTEILYSDISADGEFALTANYYNLVLWNTSTGEPVWFWSAPARIEAVDLSADGRFALLGLDNNKAVLFDVQNGGVLREFEHGGPVTTVALNVATGRALTGSEDTMVRFWDIRSAQLLQTFDYVNHIALVKFSDSGTLALMVPSNEKAELWNVATRRKIADLSTAKFRLYSARFIGDSRLITGTTHRNIFEFDVRTGKKTQTWQIGTEGKQAFRSAIVLDVGWQENRLVAIGSNGYLYAF